MHYTKCLHCAMFVEENYGHEEGEAAYVHLSRGDAADDAIESTHEAAPGMMRSLTWWQYQGPADVRARFLAPR